MGYDLSPVLNNKHLTQELSPFFFYISRTQGLYC